MMSLLDFIASIFIYLFVFFPTVLILMVLAIICLPISLIVCVIYWLIGKISDWFN